jgi:hypothetical protein
MEVTEPLAVLDVGLAAREVLAVAGIDQADLEAGRLEDLEEGDPIDAGGLHRDGGDTTGLQPVPKGVEVFGEGGKAAYGIRVGFRSDGDIDAPCADVDAGGVGMENNGSRSTGRLGSILARRFHRSERGGRRARGVLGPMSNLLNGMTPEHRWVPKSHQ